MVTSMSLLKSKKAITYLSDLPEWTALLNDAPDVNGIKPNEVLILVNASRAGAEDWDALKKETPKPSEAWIVCSRYDPVIIGSALAAIKSYKSLSLQGIFEADAELIAAIREAADARKRAAAGSTVESNEHALFDEIGRAALQQGASDIHITRLDDRVLVSFRVKGELRPVREMSVLRGLALVTSVYNTLSEKGSTKEGFNEREYQDAVIERIFPEGLVRFRYSGLPIAPSGFDVTLRLIPIGITQKPKTLAQLGYSKDQCDALERIFSRSSGMVLIAGTTGSGKSTTLATVLTDLAAKNPGKKIRTIEEPVEYKIPGAYQTPVLRNESSGDVAKVSPFMKALRQLMRADPDIIMVGEIRDMETAQLAIQGVRSGHMLVSTIHADGAPICFDRLIGMGVERNDLCSVGLIAGLIYQKLVPVLCEHCKIPYGEWLASNDYDEALDSRIRRVVPEDELRQLYFRNRAGCPHCDHDGVRGREVVAEILRPTPKILAAVQAANSGEVWRLWRSTIDDRDPSCMTGRTAFEHAQYKMRCGIVDPRAVEDAFRFLDEPVWEGA